MIKTSGPIPVMIGFLVIGAVAVLGFRTQGAAQSTNEASKGTEIKIQNLGKPTAPEGTNCSACMKLLAENDNARAKVSAAAVVENPNSPQIRKFDKNFVYHQPVVHAGDNGALLQVDLGVPGGKIFSVLRDCIGRPCGWIHDCDGLQCVGHNVPFEFHADGTVTWWGWTNSGDNAVLVFTAHYQ